MQSRRKFLALLGIGSATIATPAAATIITHKLQNNPDTQKPTPCHEPTAEPTQVPTPKSLEPYIDKAAHYQTKANNGDFFAEWCPDKDAYAKAWQDVADREIARIEAFAHDMGLTTVWTGLYPEFYRS